MSYREVRDAIEILRALRYPRVVSIENFAMPNFELMAEILEWTVKKFDPNYRLVRAIDSEAARVLFIKTAVLALIQRARLRLNPRLLYASDGHALRELLPALRLLRASAADATADANEERAQLQSMRAEIAQTHHDVRRCINDATKLPQTSVSLYELLAKELFARDARQKALSQSLNVRNVEASLQKMIVDATAEAADYRAKLDNLSNDEQSLDAKIERRQREYDQLQKRLAKLQAFRPPYMEDYEELEVQLRVLYREYVVQFRNLNYLQEQLDELERNEHERSHEAERSMRIAVEKMRAENEKLEPTLDDTMEQVKEKAIRVYGNMTGAGVNMSDEDEDDDEDLGDAEVDLHNVDAEIDGIDESNDELHLAERSSTMHSGEQSRPPPSQRSAALAEAERRSTVASDSDDNF